jgi:hypothetical protein
VEIRRNEIYNSNSALRNAGRADKVFLEDNTVHASKNGSATVVDNLKTGRISNVTARKNLITGPPEQKPAESQSRAGP